MKTLISNTAFGKLCKSKEKEFNTRLEYLEWYEKARNSFDDFLSLTPEIWQFVACKLVDGVWVVLEEPKRPWQDSIIEEGLHERYRTELKEYQTAKERCYFEGFEVRCPNAITNGNISITFTKSGGILLDKVCDNHFENIGTITKLEQITDYNITLTATAQKEIGL